ncbi:hypothetical protein ACIRYZ_43955, partial [Kitasatospora sp. NPDC101155]|uniref:hypothetical protein n=1 Tax=Kitasatospora sp. NPDC101155 TaxID=3364097 RepID=UPI00382BAFCD
LTLNEDQDDQTIARWVTVDPPFSGQFSPVAEIGVSPPATPEKTPRNPGVSYPPAASPGLLVSKSVAVVVPMNFVCVC